MTPRQFGALTGIKYPTVIEWIRSGKLLAIPHGKGYLITDSEYQRYKSEGLRYDPHEVKNQKAKRENDRHRYHEIARLKRESAEVGSAADPGPEKEVPDLDDESEFYDGQEDFYD